MKVGSNAHAEWVAEVRARRLATSRSVLINPVVNCTSEEMDCNSVEQSKSKVILGKNIANIRLSSSDHKGTRGLSHLVETTETVPGNPRSEMPN